MVSVTLLVTMASWGLPIKSMGRQVLSVESSKPNPAVERILLRGLTRFYVEDYLGAAVVFEQGLKLQPDSPALLASLSRAKGASGDFEAARFFLRRALDLDTQNIHLWTEWADLSLELNDVEESITALEHLIENQNPSWPSRVKLSQLYYRVERYSDALQIVDTGLCEDGRVPELLFARAQVLDKIGRTTELAQTLVELSELQPDDAEIYYRLAVARIRSEEWVDAEYALNELLEVNPDHERGREALTQVLSHLGKLPKADGGNPLDLSSMQGAQVSISDLESQVAAHPDKTELKMQLADLLFDRGETLKAAKHYDQVVQSDARNLEAWSKAIEAYAKAGSAIRAIELSDEALLLFPGYVPLEVARVFALRAAGREAEARLLAEQILQRPSDPRYKEHLQRLKQELDDA